MARLGAVGGMAVMAESEVAERVERFEALAAAGKLGSDDWMGTAEMLALAKRAAGGGP